MIRAYLGLDLQVCVGDVGRGKLFSSMTIEMFPAYYLVHITDTNSKKVV